MRTGYTHTHVAFGDIKTNKHLKVKESGQYSSSDTLLCCCFALCFLSGGPSWCLQTICTITISAPAKQDSGDLFVNCSTDGAIVSLCTWPAVKNCWLIDAPHPAFLFWGGQSWALIFTIKTNKEHKDIYHCSDLVI